MRDSYKLSVLTDLRRAARVTLEQMARACGLSGKKSRESVGAWERGQSVPHARQRTKFIDYLGNTLGLRHDPAKFHAVWDVLIEEWEWEPVNDKEWQQHFDDEHVATGRSTALPAPTFVVDDQRLATAQALLNGLPTASIPRVAPLPAGSYIPYARNPLFVGRHANLLALAATLKPRDETDADVCITAITGMGGIGKTQLASEFAHRYGQYFAGGVLWLSFANEASVPTQIVLCGGADRMNLHAHFDTLPFDLRMRLVRAAWQSALPRLLIFDNCEDPLLLQQWCPTTGGARVLLTSRRATWDAALGIHVLPLRGFDRKESIHLLHQYRADVSLDDPSFDAIAADLGALPLALHLAGNYLGRYQHVVTPAGYLEQLQGQAILDHASLQGGNVSPTRHQQHVARTFALSYNQLDPSLFQDRHALTLLARAAYFAPGEPIPHRLLVATLQASTSATPATLHAQDAVTRLIELGLLEVVGSQHHETTLRMHRLFVAFVRDVTSDETAQGAVEQVLLTTVRHLNEIDAQQQLLMLQPHLRAVTDAALPDTNERAADLSYELSLHLLQIEDYVGAEYYNQRSLAIRTAVFGENHPAIVDNLHHLGWILDCQTREAQPYHERALTIRRLVFGNVHPSTAESLNYVGTVLHARCDYEGARHHYEQALAIREQALGEYHQDTAQSLNNLGLLLHAMGHYAHARTYLQRALTIREQLPHSNPSKLAITLNNLGYLLRAMGDYDEARMHLEHALAIREQMFGPHNTYVAVTLNHLGRLAHYCGDYAQAHILGERAFVLREHMLGRSHPDTANSLTNIGMVFFDQGEYKQARVYVQQALTLHTQVWGLHHRHTARSLNHLGMVLHQFGDYVAAQQYFAQALGVREQVLGPQHPDTANSLSHVGMICYEQGDYGQAHRYIKKALTLHQHVLGNTHPYTARSFNRMSLVLHAQGNLDEARSISKRAVAIYKHTLGPTHPFTVLCLEHAAMLLSAQNNG